MMKAFPNVPKHTPSMNTQFTEDDYKRIFNMGQGGISNIMDFISYLMKQHIPRADKDEYYNLMRYPSYSGIRHYLTTIGANFDALFRKWIASLSDLQMRMVLLRKEGGKRKQTRRYRYHKSRKQTRKH